MNKILNADKKKEIIAYLLLIITAIIWGGTWPLGRWLVSEEVGGSTIPPLMIATIRYFLVIIPFFLLLKAQEKTINWKFARANWKPIVFMGLTSVVIYQIGYLLGEYFTAASDASILIATNAIWVNILSHKFLKAESFTWRKFMGTLLAFIAVILVIGFSPNLNVPNRILGDILILIGAFAYAVYTVTSRSFMNKSKDNLESYQPTSLWIMTWVSFCGFLLLLPLSLIISPQYLNPIEYFVIPTRIWIGIAYLAFISTIGAYTFYLEGVKRLNASRAAIFQTLVPLFGVLFSALFLKEQFDLLIYPCSLLLVILGIIIANRKSSHEKREEKNLLFRKKD